MLVWIAILLIAGVVLWLLAISILIARSMAHYVRETTVVHVALWEWLVASHHQGHWCCCCRKGAARD